MNKQGLVEVMAKASGISKSQANKALSCLTQSITKSLKKGDRITLVGFGSFSTAKRKARKGVNPQNGKPIQIKARVVPKFSAGQALKDAVK
ncbi:MAG: DNA-binding protein [Candidatus Schekmanbacteria bacterium RBG_16_38_11]|uniref:DNA-binding protein n=1 Tax=Candidatus Schekmanbacteria bacterium RBG_16_38_11 TaxID=1817880 RepID=A0A1F7RXN1_9BACT|nr:MAG: DNA-binding protein [Candidatus Schekmanbacteria bacterium RBG_16_38_11]